ncbi:serine/threonine-protein kinase [Streptomyces sp. ADI95-16]|uniref:serine/threonine-protein kinase n=1 Tax=Streptomyces sp. ADI95-16 TaxID=1522758 RepID=UPI0013DE327F|nr:serine/threonine-protein kinase [Streptomyces sp. ADI95-16]
MPDDHLILRPLYRGDPTSLGPYRLLGRIGAGGMGRVYLANRNGTEGLYAVKTLLVEGLTTDGDRVRFAREVKMARRAAGLRTARVFDADPQAPLPWLATEYVAAPSLGDLVARCGTAHPAAIARIVADCATALEELHSTGVIHRDLKPHNILLTSQGIRLIDFGISHASDLTRTRVTLGTVAYIAPEQARGEPATAACDIWALGATLCTLAAGHPPYPDTGDPVRLLALVSRAAVDLRDLPAPLRPLAAACLAPDAADRPTPAELRVLAERGTAHRSSRTDAAEPPDSWIALISDYENEGEELRDQHAPDPPAPGHERTQRIAGLTPEGWKAAGSLISNLTMLIVLGAAGLLTLITVVAVIVIALSP